MLLDKTLKHSFHECLPEKFPFKTRDCLLTVVYTRIYTTRRHKESVYIDLERQYESLHGYGR